MKSANLFLAGALLASTAVMAATAIPSTIKDAVSDSGRPEADTKRDEGRKPAEQLAWAGIKPGLVVVDLLPGGGYFTRLFAKAVGPKGRVYAYFGTQYDARLKSQGKDPDNQFADLKAKYPNLGVIHGPLEQFVTPEPVDVVWTEQNYHDMHNKSFGVDSVTVDKAIFKSLKPGGFYIIVDHRAAKGAGLAATETLHRMDEDVAKQEVESAGFKLVSEDTLLKNPSDDNTKRVFEAGEHDHTDQFMLKFQKPRH